MIMIIIRIQKFTKYNTSNRHSINIVLLKWYKGNL